MNAKSIAYTDCEVKACTVCKIIKPIDSFSKRSARPSGRVSRCKDCAAHAWTTWVGENKEYNQARALEYSRNNKDREAARGKKYRQENKEKVLASANAWRLNNAEKVKKMKQAWRAANKEKIRKQKIAWRNANRERANNASRILMKKRLSSNPIFKLSCNVRTLISQAVKRGGYTKKAKTAEILGCSFEFFKSHIERQFPKGMTWDNRDQWHLDHIIPYASAKTEGDVLRLSHFTNVRPMWAKDNLAKKDKILTLL